MPKGSRTGSSIEEELRQRIAGGKAMIVVGAGVSIGASGGAEAASWCGLLESGIREVEGIAGRVPAGWGDPWRKLIGLGHGPSMVLAAEAVATALGAPHGDYGGWLRRNVGELPLADRSVLEAIAALRCPIATTNYDDLLEQVTGLTAITYRQKNKVHRFLEGADARILHLHGHWEEPESAILGIRSYEALRHDGPAQFFQQMVAVDRSLVFIGCGPGLQDPNIGALLDWHRETFADLEIRHYHLVLDSEVEERNRAYAGSRLVALGYKGSPKDHAGLPDLLARLAPPAALAPGAAPAPAAIASTSGPTPAESLAVYLADVAAQHQRLLSLLPDEQDGPLLDLVYVELSLRPEDLLEGVGESGQEPRRKQLPDHRLDIRRLLCLDRDAFPWVTGRWVLLGDPGSGKSTLLRHLAREQAKLAEDARWLPVFATVRELAALEAPLLDQVADEFSRSDRRAAALPPAFRQAHEDGRLLFLLDGFDEVDDDRRAAAQRAVERLARAYPRASVVLTSRPSFFPKDFAAVFRYAGVRPLDPAQQRQLLAAWFGRDASEPDFERADRELAAITGDRVLAELAANPLLLGFIARLREKEISLHPRRAQLYAQMIGFLLDGLHRSARPRKLPAGEAPRGLLAALAHRLTAENRDETNSGHLVGLLHELAGDPDEQVQRWSALLVQVERWRKAETGPQLAFLQEVGRRTDLLASVFRQPDRWRFLHRTFREALCAEHLERLWASEGGRTELLDHAGGLKEADRQWAEPYALLAGLIADPDELVRALMAVNPSLGLRALATAEGVDPSTFSALLKLTDNWQERAEIFRQLPEQVADPARALRLIEALAGATRDGNDLFFLDLAVRRVARDHPEQAVATESLLARFFDHIAVNAEVLEVLRWVRVKGRRVALWTDIPAGCFQMGSPEGVGYDDEHPRHEVEILSPFRFGVVPVTQAQYALFDPEHLSAEVEGMPPEELAHHPVTEVTWYAAVSVCRWLSRWLPEAKGRARLPTEEEWEYACRAGTDTEYWKGDGEQALQQVGWYSENSKGRTHRVGELPRNAFGLYDVHGNVDEWTTSPSMGSYESAASSVDPATVNPLASLDLDDPDDVSRVIRGGSFAGTAHGARSACRYWGHPAGEWLDRGFRVILPAPSDRP